MPGGNELQGADVCYTMYEGSKTFWKERINIDLTIVSHFLGRIIEVILFNPIANVEYPRVYVDGVECKKTGLNLQAFNDELKAKKEDCIRHHKEIHEDSFIKEITNKMMIQYILQHIGLIKDSSSTKSNDGSGRLKNKCDYIATLVPRYGDAVLDEEPMTLRTICNKPKKLLPYQTKNMKAAKEGEVEAALHRVEHERFQLHQATVIASLATTSVNGFKAVLEKKMELKGEHNKVRRRWQKAIRRVIIQNYVRNVTIRLVNSSFREWYISLLRRQREIEEKEEEERKADEIAKKLRHDLKIQMKNGILHEQHRHSDVRGHQSSHRNHNCEQPRKHRVDGNDSLPSDHPAPSDDKLFEKRPMDDSICVDSTAERNNRRKGRHTMDNSTLLDKGTDGKNAIFMERLHLHRHKHGEHPHFHVHPLVTPYHHSEAHELPKVDVVHHDDDHHKSTERPREREHRPDHLPLIDVSPSSGLSGSSGSDHGKKSPYHAFDRTSHHENEECGRNEHWKDGTTHHRTTSEVAEQLLHDYHPTPSPMHAITKHSKTISHRPLENDPFFKRENSQIRSLNLPIVDDHKVGNDAAASQLVASKSLSKIGVGAKSPKRQQSKLKEKDTNQQLLPARAPPSLVQSFERAVSKLDQNLPVSSIGVVESAHFVA